MARLAVACLRATNPHASIVIACDNDTDLLIRHTADPLEEAADHWIVVQTPTGDANFRNRFVKTSVRSMMVGPFLLLDSDVVVRGDLSQIFSLDTDIACARNHSRKKYGEQLSERDAAIITKMGWRISREAYYNAGVIYFGDTPTARSVSAEWHRLWLLTTSKLSVHRDQPAFNTALHDVRPKISILPDRFNAQFKKTPSSVNGAHIWHYYTSMPTTPTTYDKWIEQIVSGEEPTNIAAITIKHPWSCPKFIHLAAVAWLLHSSNDDCWASYLLRGQMKSYCASRLLAHASGFQPLLPPKFREMVRRRLGLGAPS